MVLACRAGCWGPGSPANPSTTTCARLHDPFAGPRDCPPCAACGRGASYLLGSIPFGLVITRALGLGDLRAIGSGNIGATNVLRTGNKGAALATLLLDAGKGGVAVLIARALTARTGRKSRRWPRFWGISSRSGWAFRGGKGVATFLGTLIALAWPAGLLACAAWLVVAGLTRISSLSALVAAASAPVWLILSGHAEAAALCILLAALVFVRHAENIARLRAGTEPRIGARKS
jgi:acyl phosphate:glycerol-3-phosphate acyltransferase